MFNLEPVGIAPNSQDAEEGVLGSILINFEQFNAVKDILTPECFFILRNGWIYEAMQRLYARKEPIEYLTVIEEVRNQSRLENIGGAAYITYLASNVATSVYAQAYAVIVKRAYMRRRLLEAAACIAQLAYDENMELKDVIDESEKELGHITIEYHKDSVGALQPVSELVESDIEDMSKAYQAYESGKPMGLSTGFNVLEDFFRLLPTNLITFASRPGVGKSAILLTIIYNLLIAPFICENKPGEERQYHRLITSKRYIIAPTEAEIEALPRLALFSTEMSEPENIARFAAMMTGIPAKHQLTGSMTFNEFSDVTHAKNIIGQLQDRFLLKCGAMTPDYTWQQVKLWRPDMIFTDYLQRFSAPPHVRASNRVDELTYISRTHKDMAMEENIPVLTGAQISRDGANKPSLETLKGSGSIEEDSNIVVLLHKEEGVKTGEVKLDVAKNRNGATGECSLFFLANRTLFKPIEKTRIELNPRH